MRLFALALLFGFALAAPNMSSAQTAVTSQERKPVRAVVTDVRDPKEGETAERVFVLRFLEGELKGQTGVIGDDEAVASTGFTDYRVGERVIVAVIDHIDGSTRYLITDYERRQNLWWILAAFVLGVVWLNRWRGVRSLLGLAFSYAVIVWWIVPMIAGGRDPLTVTIAGGAAVLLVSLLVTEGINRASFAAGSGMIVAMLATGLLSTAAVAFARLTGQASEEAFFLQNQGFTNIDVRGLLLAGFIIGALGVLDDIAVSQVAAVAELRRANPRQSGRDLYRAALRVGRSHMAAIVNTLVLAYAGSALPLLVLFNVGGSPAGLIINSELVATEIVRAVVGSLGLIFALPLSTAFAVWFKVRSTHGHGHAHFTDSHSSLPGTSSAGRR